MNIICNNCVGARLYEVNHIQFNNPFMWCSIKTPDYINLIKNFEMHDFANAKFELEHYYGKTDESVLVTIDDNIQLHYIHHIYDEKAVEPRKERNTDIYYKDIIEYAKDKFSKRVERMTFDNIKFLYSFNYMKEDDEKYYDILKQLDETGMHITCIVHENVKYESSNLELINCSNETMELNGTVLAKTLTEKYLKFIL